MKYVLLTLVFCASSIQLSAQKDTAVQPQPDQRLYEVYKSDYIDQLLVSNPFLIKRWNFYLDHAYSVVDESGAKATEYPTVNISDLEHINILLLEKEQGLTRNYDKPTVYKIANTNKLLIYKSGKQFNKLLRAALLE